jgi:hypothetical protein
LLASPAATPRSTKTAFFFFFNQLCVCVFVQSGEEFVWFARQIRSKYIRRSETPKNLNYKKGVFVLLLLVVHINRSSVANSHSPRGFLFYLKETLFVEMSRGDKKE